MKLQDWRCSQGCVRRHQHYRYLGESFKNKSKCTFTWDHWCSHILFAIMKKPPLYSPNATYRCLSYSALESWGLWFFSLIWTVFVRALNNQISQKRHFKGFSAQVLRDWQVPVLVSWHTYCWCPELSGKKPDHPPKVDKLCDYIERKRVTAELIIPKVPAKLPEMWIKLYWTHQISSSLSCDSGDRM